MQQATPNSVVNSVHPSSHPPKTTRTPGSALETLIPMRLCSSPNPIPSSTHPRPSKEFKRHHDQESLSPASSPHRLVPSGAQLSVVSFLILMCPSGSLSLPPFPNPPAPGCACLQIPGPSYLFLEDLHPWLIVTHSKPLLS